METGNWTDIANVSRLPLLTIVISMAAACLLGGLLGLEREWRDKAAGLRTYILIALAAATFALLTRDYFERASVPEEFMFDVVRGVAGGAAILAAGTVISARGTVRGLTTGTGMWLAAAIGLASGLGAYVLAGIASLFGLVILRLFGILERLAASRHGADNGAESVPGEEEPGNAR